MLKVWVEKYGKFFRTIAFGLVLFIAGWYTGRAMSPYYAAHPIVFEDRACDGCASSGGSTQELTALKEEGIALRDKDAPEEKAVAQTTPTPAVAGAVDPSPTPAAATEQKMFVGSVNSDKYHFPDCPSAKRIKEENQVWFASKEEAEKAGYEPSACVVERLK